MRFYISLICLVTMLVSGSLVAYNALKVLYEGSLRDASAILFLDLEKQANRAAEEILEIADESVRQEPVVEFILLGRGAIKSKTGVWDQYGTIEDLGLNDDQLNPAGGIKHALTNVKGDYYVAKIQGTPTGNVLRLFKTTMGTIAPLFQFKEKKTIVYITNRSATLMFSSSLAVKPANVSSRPLVAAFVQKPMSQAQSEYTLGKDSFYGFYQELPGTNMIMFAEKTKRRAMENVYKAMKGVSKVTGGIFLAAIVLLQIPLFFMTRPLKKLANAAAAVSSGDLAVTMEVSGFGELKALTSAFNTMTRNLAERAQVIARFNEERILQTQIENDLKLARAIQDQFLFHPEIAPEAGLDVASVYVPATQVAGDWMGVHHFPDTGDTVLAIVDITGHGVSSAMLTPVISVLFYEFTRQSGDRNLLEFLTRCNDALFMYGNGSSTATGLIARFNRNSRKLEFYNAGHPKPIILDSSGQRVASDLAEPQSCILGLIDTITCLRQEVTLESGGQFLMFSDGLTPDAPRGEPARRVGKRELTSVLLKTTEGGAKAKIAAIEAMWREMVPRTMDTDDMCAIAGVIS